jgi:dsRNA-specific ribonuclease
LLPGILTKLKDVYRGTKKFARISLKHNLHRYLHYKKPLLKEQIRRFTKDILDYPLYSHWFIKAQKTLAHMVKIVVGAIYEDNKQFFDSVKEHSKV